MSREHLSSVSQPVDQHAGQQASQKHSQPAKLMSNEHSLPRAAAELLAAANKERSSCTSHLIVKAGCTTCLITQTL